VNKIEPVTRFGTHGWKILKRESYKYFLIDIWKYMDNMYLVQIRKNLGDSRTDEVMWQKEIVGSTKEMILEQVKRQIDNMEV
jgi:hypothetical protein